MRRMSVRVNSERTAEEISGRVPLICQQAELNQCVVLLRVDEQDFLEHLLCQGDFLRVQIDLRQSLVFRIAQQ
jgi:hypothetical protein